MMRIKSILNKFISNGNSTVTNYANYKNCSYCNKPFTQKLWCKKCDPRRIMEGWTSENSDIDKFIKDTIYDARHESASKFLEWIPFGRFTDVKEIGDGFSKVHSATWIGGKEPMKVALKRLSGSRDMSAEYLNELKAHWNLCKSENTLGFYGMTKDPKTEEFMMITQLANERNLRNTLSKNFNDISWKDKIELLCDLSCNLKDLHKSGYFHKDFHSGNILQTKNITSYSSFTSNFELSGPANEQKSDNKIYGVLPYIAPEVLNGEPYTSSSDIYSFGVVMTELSFGKPPFRDKKHDLSLALEICNGLRPEFGKGTPKIYKQLAYKCMNANPGERPTANELEGILIFWYSSICNRKYQEKELFGYKGKEIKTMFEEADKEIPNISNSYKKNSGAVYTSRAFTFNNLPKPVNSSIIITTLYEDNEDLIDFHDSQLIDLS